MCILIDDGFVDVVVVVVGVGGGGCVGGFRKRRKGKVFI